MKNPAPFDRSAFSALIDSLNLRYFKPHEFLEAVDSVKDGVKNSPPPHHLILNIVPLALLVDEVRHRLGKPMTFNSVYRNEEYNLAWDGKPLSSHCDFTAADIVVKGVEPRLVAKQFERLRDRPISCPIDLPYPANPRNFKSFKPILLSVEKTGAGTSFIFRGGIKVYNTFTHVDTRGWNASW